MAIHAPCTVWRAIRSLPALRTKGAHWPRVAP